MSRLTCRGLTRLPWFQDLDLDLATGQITVLTGPSGSGKSLLLRALADLDPVDAGTIELEGTNSCDMPAPQWRSQVLYVHPGAVRTPGTVAENMAAVSELCVHASKAEFPPAPLPPEADAERLSSGEGAWLALFRALGPAPEVLLLDEITASLDPDSARRAEAEIGRFTEGGGTVLWISHDPTLAERIGARHVTWERLTQKGAQR